MFWVSLPGVPAQITESNFLVFSKEDIITTLNERELQFSIGDGDGDGDGRAKNVLVVFIPSPGRRRRRGPKIDRASESSEFLSPIFFRGGSGC